MLFKVMLFNSREKWYFNNYLSSIYTPVAAKRHIKISELDGQQFWSFFKLRQAIIFRRIGYLPQSCYQMTLLNEIFPTVYNMLGFETKNVHPQVDALKVLP